MTKQRNPNCRFLTPAEIKINADRCLAVIAADTAEILSRESEAKAAMQVLEAEHIALLAPARASLKLHVAMITDMMKSNKAALFDGTEIVRLINGSLIHSVADKVSIPRDALAKCEELGFDDAVKIAKSLDREAVEKWPDERLILIGAERKQKEEFSYDLAEVKPCEER
jgi:hypothetical protein